MENPSKAMIPIDKNVPLAPHGSKYPFRNMEVGDSFFAESSRNSLMASASRLSKDGKKFTSRGVTENGVKGTRVWRIQ